MRIRFCTIRHLLATGVIVAAACGGSDAGPTGPDGPAAINLSSSSLVLTALGETARLSATVVDARGGTVPGVAVTWTSSRPTVATIDGSGLVTALGVGTATITARAGTLEADASVNVSQLAHSVMISGTSNRTLALGDTLRLDAEARDANARTIAGAAITWSSSDPTVATVDALGTVSALRAGGATISARTAGVASPASVAVQIVSVKVEAIPAALAAPAPGALWEIPVVIIRYIPTLDGQHVDAAEGGISGTLNDIRRRIDVFEERIKFMLEEGSRFRGYQGGASAYSLGYRVVHIVTVFSHFERGKEVPWNPGHFFPDYHKILAQVDAESWVNDHGVKEFWVWGYHSNQFEQPESNMSSPVTGDISNSSRFNDDLPVFNNTYTVYGYNFARSQAEAVHNHGHQLEAILSHIDGALFWKEFVGKDASNTYFLTGRAGWTHMPPNTTNHYDYQNGTVVASDIADWKPGGGQTTPVSASTWGNVPYAWPASRLAGESSIFQRIESQWYIYWMQSMPGRDNGITYAGGRLTNWWRFTGDWDGAIRDGDRLTTATTSTSITVRNDFTGGITLQPGGSLAPGQSVILTAGAPTSVAVWDCGEAGGCKWDPYTLQPGKHYRVISDPVGPAANLTIVEHTP